MGLHISQYVDSTEPVKVVSVEDTRVQLWEVERCGDEALVKLDKLWTVLLLYDHLGDAK